MRIETFKQITFRIVIKDNLTQIRFSGLLLKLMTILVMVWGCSKKSSEPEFRLEELSFDYHYMKYETLKSLDTIYSPENVILIFEVYNPTQTSLDFSLYSKRNREESLSAFCFIYKRDTILLRSVKNEIIIQPDEKGKVYTEFPFETYGPVKEIFKKALSRTKANDLEKVSIIFKKHVNADHYAPVDIKTSKANLTCSDTTLAIQVF